MDPIVSICCVTYNHEDYLQECLDGFLMQKTNFEFEVLVHEDASTDKTAEILKSYEKKFPGKLRCVYQTENQFKKQNVLTEILFKMAQGKYIALCEGDDYWSDPNKLQKQVDFLESNPEYMASYHRAMLINETGSIIKKEKYDNYSDYSENELLTGYGELITNAVMFRSILEIIPEFSKVHNGDTTFWHLFGFYGKAKFQHDILPSAYRIHSGGIWTGAQEYSKLKSSLITYEVIVNNLKFKIKEPIYKKTLKIVYKLLNDYIIKAILEKRYVEVFKVYWLTLKTSFIPILGLVSFQFKFLLAKLK